MTKQRIVVHIGGSKCGSSAIQRFLKTNAEALAAQNQFVAHKNLMDNSELSGEQIWYFQNMMDGDTSHAPRFRARVAEIMKSKSPDATLILSAENLSNPHGFETLFAGLEEQFEIRIVFYIRRQDDYLMSAWQQWFLKSNTDFWSWCTQQVGVRANWQLSIMPWVEAFGRDAFTVRIFERESLIGQDINRDFCEVLGCDTENLYFDVGTINPSFNLAVQELAESAQSLFTGMHDNRFYEMVGALTADRHYKRSGEAFLTRFQRIAIMTRYEESNNWIKDQFFPDHERDSLFAAVPARSFSNPIRTVEQEKEAVLLDLIFQLYKRLETK